MGIAELPSIQDTGGLVRGFFLALNRKQIRSAALHGWENGFDESLSDVDIVVSKEALPSMPKLVSEYANNAGWRLCQVLRHESTAGFYVVSRRREPEVVVALDICSDYRAGERVLMTAEELLEGRERLVWGGYRLSSEKELRYRFLKAGVKSKTGADAGSGLAAFPERSRLSLASWLGERWGVTMEGWKPDLLEKSWTQVAECVRQEPRLLEFSALERIWGRVVCPTGLVVEVADDSRRSQVLDVFGRLYFRRKIVSDAFSPSYFKLLPLSGLVVCRHVPPRWRKILGADLHVVAEDGEPGDLLVDRIAEHLEGRCVRRENFREVHE